MTLDEKMVYLRKEKGLSQLQLAEMMDVSRQAISRWETGASAPSSENLKYLSTLYQVSLDYLLDDSQEKPVQNDDQTAHIPENQQPPPLMTDNEICKRTFSFLPEKDRLKDRTRKHKGSPVISYILYLGTMGFLLILGMITNVHILPEFALSFQFSLIFYYLNIFGIFFILSVCLVVLIFTKSIMAIKDSFLFMFRRKELTLVQSENCLAAVQTVIVSGFISGTLLFLMSIINILHSTNLSSNAHSHIGSQFNMGVTALIYSSIIFLIFLPVYIALKRGLAEKRSEK